MSAEKFMKLVEEQKGFEFSQAYRDDVDHILGGKDGTYWYVIMKKGRVVETWIGKYRGGVWEDTYIKGSGASRKIKAMPAGSTVGRIAEKAYFMQEEKWVAGRKPRLVEDAHPHFHYVYGFGDKALDVSQQFGVSIAFSDIGDPSAGFHLRYLYTGADVEAPQA